MNPPTSMSCMIHLIGDFSEDDLMHITQDLVGDTLWLTVLQSADDENTDCTLYWYKSHYRPIFVYIFCLINICLSLSYGANKTNRLNIERE